MKKNFIKYLSASSILMGQIPAVRADVAWNRIEPQDPPPVMKQAGLTPRASNLSSLTNDVYFGYQWALKNEGQSFTAKIGNLFFQDPIFSSPSIQIGWENFDDRMKKEIRIGVLDSGMYSTKGGPDDLKESLNLAEGKDFVIKEGKIFDDKIGHGTHVAGIIGARMNNDLGISGVTNKVKIIPLRVYTDRSQEQMKDNENTVTDTRTSNAVTPRIIAAIKYAIEKKMDVLNLSLGWPKKEDNKEVREAFQQAADAGLIIVAASGNDGNSMQLYPCAYKQVICVGSISMDGSTSKFSNYGNHVDLMAPGQGILSLIPPTETIFSNVFGVKGYEIKNGTSQAAPFVTAAAAILKGIYPEESAEDIKNRLLLGAVKLNDSSLFGLLNIKNSVNLTKKEIAYASAKGVEDAVVDTKNLSFEFPVTVYSNLPKAPTVNVKSETAGIRVLEVKAQNQNGHETIYTVKAQADSLQASHLFDYSVTVNERSFKANLILKQELKSLASEQLEVLNSEAAVKTGFLPVNSTSLVDTKKIEFWSFLPDKEKKNFKLQVWSQKGKQLVDRSIVIENLEGPFSGFNLTRDDFDFDGKADYMLIANRNAGTKDLEFEIVYLDENLQVKYRLPIEKDLVEKSGERFYSKLFDFKSVKDMTFVRTKAPTVSGFLKAPFFEGVTLAPNADLRSRFHSQAEANAAKDKPVSSEEAIAARGLPLTEENSPHSQYFYLQPMSNGGQLTMALRSMTSEIAEAQLRRLLYEKKVKLLLLEGPYKDQINPQELQQALDKDQLALFIAKSSFNSKMSQDEKNLLFASDLDKDLKFHGILPNSYSSSRQGLGKILASLGRGVDKIYYRLTFKDLSLRLQGAEIEAFRLNGIDLDRNTMDEIINLNRGLVDTEVGLSAMYSWTGGTSLVLRQNRIGGQKIQLTDKNEALAGILETFTKGNDMLDILDTTSFIRMRGTWNGQKVDEKSVVFRSSFLPGYSFAEMFRPVIVSEKQNPGVMIDSSDIFSNRLTIYTLESDGKMRSSIERSIEIPKFCKAKRQTFLNDQGFSIVPILCGEKIEHAGAEPTYRVFVEMVNLK